MPYNPHIHHRRSIRLKGYDYSQAGLYFITICAQNRAHLFGEITVGAALVAALDEKGRPQDHAQMILNDAGMMIVNDFKIDPVPVQQGVLEYPQDIKDYLNANVKNIMIAETESVLKEITENIQEIMNELTGDEFNWLVYVTDSSNNVLVSTLEARQLKQLRKELKDSDGLERILSQPNVDFSHFKEIN